MVVAGAAVMLIVVLGGCGDQPARPAPAPAGEQVRDGFAVLVFTRTTGFRHASIDDGVAAIKRLGASHGFTVEATQDPGQVQDAVLSRYRVVPAPSARPARDRPGDRSGSSVDRFASGGMGPHR